ncbi:hypothetical protein CPLU01_09862 [Colletotrichum plurivorum]|uniref:Uncharacterized protein n=1 Tax=Colletotrichum plurivorum TaxID=2175906 RepID=A0A8H6NB42_9PEZI|nr:hypothetical protein CPLU01_09862 [Colletotrichum plurivorum]
MDGGFLADQSCRISQRPPSSPLPIAGLSSRKDGSVPPGPGTMDGLRAQTVLRLLNPAIGAVWFVRYEEDTLPAELKGATVERFRLSPSR